MFPIRAARSTVDLSLVQLMMDGSIEVGGGGWMKKVSRTMSQMRRREEAWWGGCGGEAYRAGWSVSMSFTRRPWHPPRLLLLLTSPLPPIAVPVSLSLRRALRRAEFS